MYNEPAPGAGPDELDVLDQVGLVEQQMAFLGIESYRLGIGNDFMNQIGSLAANPPDFVFNLAESIGNKGKLVYFAPALLGLNGLRYSGCPLEAIFITSNKTLAAKLMNLGGIPVPLSARPGETDKLHFGRKYIIKPLWEDGSAGITADSVFTYSPEDEERLAELRPDVWFVEEFIDGREFNISMFAGPDGPVVLPPAEIEFRNFDAGRPKIVDYKAKWETDSFEYINTVRVFPSDIFQTRLGEKLRSVCTEVWNLLGLKGYARVDIRCNSNNEPFVLEVNANPCISPDSGFIAACREAGYELPEVFANIINDLN